MKIAYIGQKGIPAVTGGVERYVEEVSTRMAGLGHEVFVYARRNYTDKAIKEYKGVKVISLPSIPTKNLDAISHTFLASLHALFQGYDVIHYSSIGPTSLSFIPKLFTEKTAIVSTFQCQDYLHKKWGFLARLYLRFSESLTCRVPDRTIAVSEILFRYSKDKYGKELTCIPNGTNIKSNERTDQLRAFGLEQNGYILAASRLVGHKGVHYLIKAFNSLTKKGLAGGKKLVIAGGGAYTDKYVRRLHKLAKGNRHILFTGTVSGEKHEQLFSHCYAFVQPSESEGMSLALLEAMGYGRAILASDIPENLETLKGTGFTFKNRSVSDLEAKLSLLIEDVTLTEAAAQASLVVARKHYLWDRIVSKIEEIYTDLHAAKNGLKKTIIIYRKKSLAENLSRHEI